MKRQLAKINLIVLIIGMSISANAQNWSLMGNPLSGVATPRLGSTDALDLQFITDNQFRMNLTQNGWLGLGI